MTDTTATTTTTEAELIGYLIELVCDVMGDVRSGHDQQLDLDLDPATLANSHDDAPMPARYVNVAIMASVEDVLVRLSVVADGEALASWDVPTYYGRMANDLQAEATGKAAEQLVAALR